MKVQLYCLITTAFVTLSGTALAADAFDGKKPLLCTVQQLHECDAHSGCALVPVTVSEDIRHLSFDFKKKTVQLDHWDPGVSSSIERVESVDEMLIVQGLDSGRVSEADGGGWAMSVNRNYGTMVMTVSGAGVAFVGLGSCIGN